MSVRAARGAIVVAENTREQVLAQTAKLVGELLVRNDLAEADLISAFFTTTPDLTAAFPAEGARDAGLVAVPLLCAQEIPVQGAMQRVVRVLLHFDTARDRADVVHVYLDGAEALRDDLV